MFFLTSSLQQPPFPEMLLVTEEMIRAFKVIKCSDLQVICVRFPTVSLAKEGHMISPYFMARNLPSYHGPKRRSRKARRQNQWLLHHDLLFVFFFLLIYSSATIVSRQSFWEKKKKEVKFSLPSSFLLSFPTAYGSSWARDWITATTATYIATGAMPDL